MSNVHPSTASPPERFQLALATCAALPQLDVDERYSLEALATDHPDIDVHLPIWNDPTVDWKAFDAVIIRCTWDYHDHLDAFRQWVNHVASVTTLWNPPSLIQWNADKTYLQGLSRSGIPTVPTRWFFPGDSLTSDVLQREIPSHWSQVVAKPSVSAGGRNTFQWDRSSLMEPDNLQYLTQWQQDGKTVMIQPYLDSIHSHGELALLFVNGAPVHAVGKKPAPEEFRVHENLGGQTFPTQLPEQAQNLALATMATLSPTPLYGRIDMVFCTPEGKAEAQWVITEVEILEPSLYQKYHPETGRIFAAAMAQKARSGKAARLAPFVLNLSSS